MEARGWGAGGQDLWLKACRTGFQVGRRCSRPSVLVLALLKWLQVIDAADAAAGFKKSACHCWTCGQDWTGARLWQLRVLPQV